MDRLVRNEFISI